MEKEIEKKFPAGCKVTCTNNIAYPDFQVKKGDIGRVVKWDTLQGRVLKKRIWIKWDKYNYDDKWRKVVNLPGHGIIHPKQTLLKKIDEAEIIMDDIHLLFNI